MLNFHGISAPWGNPCVFTKLVLTRVVVNMTRVSSVLRPEPSIPSRRSREKSWGRRGTISRLPCHCPIASLAYAIFMYCGLVLRSFDPFSVIQYNKGFQDHNFVKNMLSLYCYLRNGKHVPCFYRV